MDWFYQNKYKALRTYLYIILGLLAGTSMIHALLQSAFSSDPRLNSMPTGKIALLIGISGATYIIGAHFYIFKIPERFRPGFFDIWLNSHTIWHFFVFMAAILHFLGMIEAYSTRILHKCQA